MELYELRQKQSLSLEMKIVLSEERIRQFYEYHNGNVYISFSGGKDSTVMLHLIRSIYPDIPAVFVNTGLEYPEIVDFVKTFDNIEILRPRMNFKKVIQTYGYPVGSKIISRQIRELQTATNKNQNTRNLIMTGIKKNGSKSSFFKIAQCWIPFVNSKFKISEKCCDIMKKIPIHEYEKKYNKKGYVGIMASDSRQRESTYLRTGCNSYNKNSKSRPLSFWLEQDVWLYIKQNKIPYCSIYDTGVHRTGCMFCMFGVHMEKSPNRFQLMEKTHPNQYKYCIEALNLKEILEFMNVPYEAEKSLFDEVI